MVFNVDIKLAISVWQRERIFSGEISKVNGVISFDVLFEAFDGVTIKTPSKKKISEHYFIKQSYLV